MAVQESEIHYPCTKERDSVRQSDNSILLINHGTCASSLPLQVAFGQNCNPHEHCHEPLVSDTSMSKW